MNDEPSTQEPANPLTEAQRLCKQIEDLRQKAENEFEGAEEARKKADSEGLFAVNAKKTCEDHATAIAGLKGVAEAALGTITSNRQKSDELVAAIPSAKAELESHASAVAEIHKRIESILAEIGAASQNASEKLKLIEALYGTAESAQKEINALRDTATQAGSKAGEARTQAEQFATQTSELRALTSQKSKDVTRLAEEMTAIASTARQEQESLTKIISHLKGSDDKTIEYERVLGDLAGRMNELIGKVEGLLPGAASASLASSFLKQRERFKASQKWWVSTFVACIVLLLAVSAPSFYAATFGGKQVEWDQVLRGVATRLPIVIPLVWLAIYAGRNYMLALRLEEDYAYKESISVAFEGYKREMNQIANGDPNNPTPLNTLCINVLKAISERPGRIYDGKQQDINLITELQTSMQQTQELAKRRVAT